MRWESGRRSQNVEDQRGRRGPMPAKAGLGGLLLVGLLMYASGKNPSEIIGMLISQGGGQIAAGGAPATEIEWRCPNRPNPGRPAPRARQVFGLARWTLGVAFPFGHPAAKSTPPLDRAKRRRCPTARKNRV